MEQKDERFDWLREMPIVSYKYLVEKEDVNLINIIHNIV